MTLKDIDDLISRIEKLSKRIEINREIGKHNLADFFSFVKDFKALLVDADYQELNEFIANLNSIVDLLDWITDKSNRSRLMVYCKEHRLVFRKEFYRHRITRFVRSRLLIRIQQDHFLKQLPCEIFRSTYNSKIIIKDINQYLKFFREFYFLFNDIVFNWINNPSPAGINVYSDLDYDLEFLFPKIKIQNNIVYLSKDNLGEEFFEYINQKKISFKTISYYDYC